jgi:CheY-like chemotaxis protein
MVPGVSVAAAECAAQAATPEKSVPEVKNADWPKRLLIVDDSKINLMVLKAHLKKLGVFDVVTANDGKEALDILTNPETEPFDLVMTDMWMPNLDGEGLVRAIRQTPSLATLPVLAVTADVEARDKAAGMGFSGILLKPVTIDTLGKALSGGL